jgi:hypothetical protein
LTKEIDCQKTRIARPKHVSASIPPVSEASIKVLSQRERNVISSVHGHLFPRSKRNRSPHLGLYMEDLTSDVLSPLSYPESYSSP